MADSKIGMTGKHVKTFFRSSLFLDLVLTFLKSVYSEAVRGKQLSLRLAISAKANVTQFVDLIFSLAV